MAKVKSENTSPELIVRSQVHAMGYRYRLHVEALAGRPDLVFPRLAKVIFVHGCFWHQHRCKRGRRLPKSNPDYWRRKLQRNAARDRDVRKALRGEGWHILVVWECQTKAKRRDWLAGRLQEFLGELRGESPDPR